MLRKAHAQASAPFFNFLPLPCPGLGQALNMLYAHQPLPLTPCCRRGVVVFCSRSIGGAQQAAASPIQPLLNFVPMSSLARLI